MGGSQQFDLDEDESGAIQLTWHERRRPNPSYNQYTVQIYKTELHRLDEFAKDHGNKNDKDIPKAEWDMIWEYHKAVSNAMAHVINNLAENEDEKVPTKRSTASGGDEL